MWTWEMCSNFDDKVIMITGDPDIRRFLPTIDVNQTEYSWGEMYITFIMSL